VTTFDRISKAGSQIPTLSDFFFENQSVTGFQIERSLLFYLVA